MQRLGPTLLFPLSPLCIAAEPARKNQIRFTITAPASWAKALTYGLEVLTLLAGGVQDEARKIEIARRAADKRSETNQVRRQILTAYKRLRDGGLLHRAAIRALTQDPRFRELGWDFAAFNFVLPRAAAWSPSCSNRNRHPLPSIDVDNAVVHTFSLSPARRFGFALRAEGPGNGVQQ